MADIQIIYPSEIKIKIPVITDGEGNIVPVQDYPYMKFLFIDDYNCIYECIYDPEGTHSKGAKISDGTLYLTIESGYKLKGRLRYKIGVRISDDVFSDGEWEWFGEFKNAGINVVCK